MIVKAHEQIASSSVSGSVSASALTGGASVGASTVVPHASLGEQLQRVGEHIRRLKAALKPGEAFPPELVKLVAYVCPHACMTTTTLPFRLE